MGAVTCAVSSVGLSSPTPWLSLGAGSLLDGPQRTGLGGRSRPVVGDGDDAVLSFRFKCFRLNVILENDQLEMSVLEKQSRRIKIKAEVGDRQ